MTAFDDASTLDLDSIEDAPNSLSEVDLTRAFREPPRHAMRRSPLDARLPGYVFASKDGAERRAATERRNARDTDERLEIGTIVEKYRIEELLGTGGFASVYRATHMLLQRPVAIKVLRAKHLRERPELVTQLCEEARFVARINHPNVVQVFDITHTDALTYIVMEYIDGEPLRRLIRKHGALPEARVLAIAEDVIRGLKAGLDNGVIHRDIKPENILVSRSGVAKIVDLGLARGTQPSPPTAGRAPVVGTQGYMAPEQAFSPEATDFRADIYSLGATLYHAATGIPPFSAPSSTAALRMQVDELIRPPEHVAPLSQGLSKLLVRMLSSLPVDRPQSYEELGEEMHRLANEAPRLGREQLTHSPHEAAESSAASFESPAGFSAGNSGTGR
jgi:serine/threonine protein kinase